jgi:peptidoglycan/xylan/chitin deacetylase (PgdA/CDA1 family)
MRELKFNRERLQGTSELDSASHFGQALMTVLSPGGSPARLSILIYHRVLPHQDALFPNEVDSLNFNRQMGWLKSCFNIIPLLDAVRSIKTGTLPPRAACITFDDGYADNAEVALPILQKHGICASFFVAAGFLNGGRMWNDTVIELVRGTPGPIFDLSAMGFGTFEIDTIEQRRQAISALLNKLKYLPLEVRKERIEQMCGLVRVTLPNNLMMSSEQVKQLHRAGMEIGGHTVNHPILARLQRAEAYSEISNGKDALGSIIRAPIRLFAYPNGKPGQDYLSDHVEMVKDIGFEAAVSTAWGVSKRGSDLHQLPRFTPWDKGSTRFMLRMAQNILRTAHTVQAPPDRTSSRSSSA